ncbi:MAG TPA: hypothetical protein VGF22_16965 [Acidimicrobiales bacterium]|jgi:hypothetical protein
MATSWSNLSQGKRRLIVAVAAVETALKIAMLIDLKRRPAGQVKGSKRVWAASAIVNSAGIIPVTYFVFGRRRASSPG